MTVVRGPSLDPGDHVIGASFDAYEQNRWRLTLFVDGEPVGEQPEVAMIYGMSPFEGITVGRDPRSPVWWERHVSHGSFPWTEARARSPSPPVLPPPGCPTM